ncbi:MAG: glycosyltransferase [Elusimicrobia bacterium]|nr:glycosyltransferase [Elusimicrobiota bacterium]
MDKLKILYLGHIVDEVPIVTGNNFTKTLISNGALYLDYIEIYNKYGYKGSHVYIEDYAVKNRVNCIIFSAPDFYFDVTFLERLRKNIFIVVLTSDTSHFYEVRDQYYAQAMDLLLITNYTTELKLRQIGINSIIYFGWFDTNQYKKIDNSSKEIDVSFIGQLKGKVGRLEYINYLLENGINIKIFGYGSSVGLITIEKKTEILNRSKINLVLTGVTEETMLTKNHKINRRKKQIKANIFEAAFCGGFVLSEYAYGIENLFEVGKEIVIFRDKEELLEKVRYYLKHEEEREKIAKKGYERVINEEDYNVKSAVPKVITAIDELRKIKKYKPSIIYLDEEFVRNYTTFRVLLFVKFIKSLKWKLAFEELKIILKNRKLDLYQIRIFFIEEILDKFPKIKSILKLIIEPKQ